jgi:hypothetical protein
MLIFDKLKNIGAFCINLFNAHRMAVIVTFLFLIYLFWVFSGGIFYMNYLHFLSAHRGVLLMSVLLLLLIAITLVFAFGNPKWSKLALVYVAFFMIYVSLTYAQTDSNTFYRSYETGAKETPLMDADYYSGMVASPGEIALRRTQHYDAAANEAQGNEAVVNEPSYMNVRGLLNYFRDSSTAKSYSEQIAFVNEWLSNSLPAEHYFNAIKRPECYEKLPHDAEAHIVQECYADFDGDGIKEGFVAVEYEPNELDMQEIWFVSDTTAIKLDGNSLSNNEWDVNGTKMIVSGEHGLAMNTLTYVWSVDNGSPKLLAILSPFGLEYSGGGQFLFYDSALDGAWDLLSEDIEIVTIGRNSKAYYMYWNGEGFIEYAGIRISEDKLRDYDGAAPILDEIKQRGYEITDIIFRGNGVVNVNYRSLLSSNNENATFIISKDGKRAEFQKNLSAYMSDEEDWLLSGSYGGIYQLSYLNTITGDPEMVKNPTPRQLVKYGLMPQEWLEYYFGD